MSHIKFAVFAARDPQRPDLTLACANDGLVRAYHHLPPDAGASAELVLSSGAV